MWVLSYILIFVYPFVGAGARSWVVDTAGHRGDSIPQGVGLLANCRVVLGT